MTRYDPKEWSPVHYQRGNVHLPVDIPLGELEELVEELTDHTDENVGGERT